MLGKEGGGKKNTEGKKKKNRRRKNQLLRAALGNPAGRRVENTAEPVLGPAALTLPRGHRPLPQGGVWQWGQTTGISVPLLHCSRLPTERNPGPTSQRLLTGFCSLGWRGAVLPLEPMDAGLPGGSRRWPGLPGSEGGSWGKTALWGAGTPLCMTGTPGRHPAPPSVPSVSAQRAPFCSPGWETASILLFEQNER